MIYTNSDSFDDQTTAAKDSRDGARDDRARGRARQRARPRDEHQPRQDLAQPLHGDEQVVAPSTDIEKHTAAPLNSETPAVAPCPSSERQAAPPEQGEKQAMTTRSKTRRREQGSKTKLCRFCLADIPTAAVRCRHCTSVLNHAEWRRRGGRHISTASRTTGGRRRTVGGPVGPSTDKNNERKEARSDGQRPRNQRAYTQRARMQGPSSRKHRHDSGDRKEASAEAGQPPHGHSAHFTCHATQRPERALGKEARAQRRRRRGGRRGDTRRAAHKAAYEAHTGKDLTRHKEAPHTKIKEASPTETDVLYFNTAPGGILEFKVDGSDKVLGRVKLNKESVTGEVLMPNVRAEERRACIAAGVNEAEPAQVRALAERLKGIQRRAPAEHRWVLSCALTYKDAAKVTIGVTDAIRELSHKARMKTAFKEAHSTRHAAITHVTKDTHRAKAQAARQRRRQEKLTQIFACWRDMAQRRTAQEKRKILKQVAFRLWCKWAERRAARRARRMFEMPWVYDEPHICHNRPSPSSYYVPDAASAAPAPRRRRTKQT